MNIFAKVRAFIEDPRGVIQFEELDKIKAEFKTELAAAEAEIALLRNKVESLTHIAGAVTSGPSAADIKVSIAAGGTNAVPVQPVAPLTVPSEGVAIIQPASISPAPETTAPAPAAVPQTTGL